MLRSFRQLRSSWSAVIVLSAGALAVACSGDGNGESDNRGPGPSVAYQRPPGNAQAPARNPQQPPGNADAPPPNPEAPLPNPQQPPNEQGSPVAPPTTGGPGPGGGVQQVCRQSCEAIVGDCRGGCQAVCNGFRDVLNACRGEVAAFFACFADIGIQCSDGEIGEFPAAECVQRLGQAGQLSQACLAALVEDGE